MPEHIVVWIENEVLKEWPYIEGKYDMITGVQRHAGRTIAISLYHHLAPEMAAMRKALEWYADPGNYTYDPDGELISSAYSDNRVGDKAKGVLDLYPSPKDKDNETIRPSKERN